MKQDNVTFNHEKILNIYVLYEINESNNISDYVTLENCLFGAVRLTKRADINKYKYSENGIEFERKEYYSIGDQVCRNVIIFGVDMSSFPHIDNKEEDILIFGKGPTQGLGEHSLPAKKLYLINFIEENTKLCLSLHYNGANTYFFVNGTEIVEFKAKDSEITTYLLCLGNISKD